MPTQTEKPANGNENASSSVSEASETGWKWEFFTKHRENTWALIGLITGAIPPIIIEAYKSIHADEPTLFSVSIFFLSGFFALVYFQFSLLHIITGKEKEIERLKNNENRLEIIVSRHNEADLEISRLFARLEKERSLFDIEILDIIRTYSHPLPQYTETIKKHLRQRIDTYLEALCNVAADVIYSKKMSPLFPLQCNIKILKGPPDNILYFPVARSTSTLPARLAADRDYEENQLRYVMLKNFYFYSIAKRRMNHFFSSNIEETFEEINKGDWGQNQFNEPRQGEAHGALTYYKSCLIAPIHGATIKSNSNHPDRITPYPFGDNSCILGFISIDSYEIGGLNETYDLNILNQIATQAFNVLRAFDEAIGSIST